MQQGAHEDKVVGAYQAALVHQYVESNHIREANTRVGVLSIFFLFP
jgi:hypothetical protein